MPGAPPSGNDSNYQRYSTIIQTITVVALFVAGFWGAVILPIQRELDSIEAGKVTISENNEFKSHVERELADLSTLKVAVAEANEFKILVDKQISALQDTIRHFPTREELKPHIDEIDNLKTSMVTRGEYIEHQHSVDQQILELSKQLDGVRAQYGNSYTIGDEVKRLQVQLDAIRASQEATTHSGAWPGAGK